jgi:hypothetical protein
MIEDYGQQVPQGDAGTSPKADIQAETTELLKDLKDELGVDFSREELESLSKSKVYTNNAAWYAEISKAAVKKSKQGAVTPAATVGTAGVPAVTGDKSYDELAAELEKLKSEGTSRENMLRDGGTAYKPETQKRIAELKARIDELEPPVSTGAFGV